MLLPMMGLSACAWQRPTRTMLALDTLITVTIYDAGTADAERALDAAFEEMARLEGLLSATRDGSDVCAINSAKGQAVVVAPETAEVLTRAIAYAELSNGALDVTIRPVSALWDFESGKLPDAAALRAAVATVDYRHISLEGTSVTLSEGAIDLGGIAKGYIADRMADVLKEQGVEAALLDLGGNIVTLGYNNKNPFRIGVKNPADTEKLCARLESANGAVVTSGIYERGFTMGDVRYHHLLDPSTGRPVQNTLASVTVVCDHAIDADALSTACFVLGEVKARQLVGGLEGVEVLFVRRDGTVSATEGLSYTLL